MKRDPLAVVALLAAILCGCGLIWLANRENERWARHEWREDMIRVEGNRNDALEWAMRQIGGNRR